MMRVSEYTRLQASLDYSKMPLSGLDKVVFNSQFDAQIKHSSTVVSTEFSKLSGVQAGMGIGTFIIDNVMLVLDAAKERHTKDCTIIKSIYVDKANRNKGNAKRAINILKKITRENAPHVLLIFPNSFEMEIDSVHELISRKMNNVLKVEEGKKGKQRPIEFWKKLGFKNLFKYSMAQKCICIDPLVYKGKTTVKDLKRIGGKYYD